MHSIGYMYGSLDVAVETLSFNLFFLLRWSLLSVVSVRQLLSNLFSLCRHARNPVSLSHSEVDMTRFLQTEWLWIINRRLSLKIGYPGMLTLITNKIIKLNCL